MAIITDTTGRQLTQAVQGISSTGISDSTGQAINNTLGTLGKDISLQGIITAISSLGQTLGSDKANISGNNIVDKSTFRQNIGCEWTSFENVISDPNSNVESIIFNKCNGVVYVSLTTNQKTFNENDVLFTITNSDLIPTNNQRLVCWSYAVDKCYTITIKSNGVVDCYGRGSITGRLLFNGFYFTL